MSLFCFVFFFFNDTATTEIYTLSLHDALPIFHNPIRILHIQFCSKYTGWPILSHDITRRTLPFIHLHFLKAFTAWRSEEHTSELQSRQYLVCRLLLEKKKNTTIEIKSHIIIQN